MDIYTCLKPEHQRQFRRLKRKTSGPWTFVVSGEWSESPCNEGNVRFYVRSSRDRRYWAALSRGFPSWIVAVAESPRAMSLTEASALMLRAVRLQGGDYIEYPDWFGRIRRHLFWDLYCARDPAAQAGRVG